MTTFACQIMLYFLLCLCLACSGNPLHSTALEDESRPKVDHCHKATTGKPAGEGRENEVQGLTETPKRPTRAVKNLKTQQESDVQAQKKKKNSKSRGNQKPMEQIDHTPQSQYLQKKFLCF